MNQMKILYVSTISNTINAFLIPHIKFLIKEGHNVDIACNVQRELPPWLAEWRCRIFNIEFSRSPLSWSNISAYRKLRSLICNEKYDLVHTHTPIASVWTRLACRDLRDVKVIYTAHGFHFYKGAPLKNWLVYYPIERYLSRYTDVLITINQEDYFRARGFHAKKVEYVPGVGISLNNYSPKDVDRIHKRKELGIPKDTFVLLSVGELNKNKNHEVIIRALKLLNNPHVYYLICGEGQLKNYLQELAKTLGVAEQVKLLGYRDDVLEICQASDVFIHPSFREGLPVAVMEAMWSELPVICSNIRGNSDLIKNGKGGYLVPPFDMCAFADKIEMLRANPAIRESMGRFNGKAIVEFGFEHVKHELKRIYNNVLGTP